jgi:hypothetical protein
VDCSCCIIALIGGASALFLGGGDLFQGRISRAVRTPSQATPAASSIDCDGEWEKIFAATGTHSNADVEYGDIDALFAASAGACDLKVVKNRDLDVGQEGVTIKCDVVKFESYPLDPSDTAPAVRTFGCNAASPTEYLGVNPSGEKMVDPVGYTFNYSEFANGHGEVGFSWHEPNFGKHIESANEAEYTVFAR